MAPLSAYIAHAMYEIDIEARSLGSDNSTDIAPALTPHQGYVLQCLALTFATISVASAVLAFYWFMKMRRSFRHDLIMLLIQSDMFKALWFMIYPIVVFVRGPIPSNSTFCQVNGFFVSLGIEASDIAVLMIAIHSALYIFRPRASAGEGGLYPYRHVAYTIWFFFPITMASLAFINGTHAYVGEGTYCYLPVRPFWYSLALSWIPRYVIFIVILGIYASIYYYVRNKFHGYNKEARIRSAPANISRGNGINLTRPQPHILPPTPPLVCHGLIPDSRQASVIEAEARKNSLPSLELYPQEVPLEKVGTHRFMWASLIENNASPSQAPPSELSTADSDSFVGPSTPQPLPRYSATLPVSPPNEGSIKSSDPSQSRLTSWRDNFVRRVTLSPGQTPSSKRSVVDIKSILRHGPGSTQVPTPASQLQLVASRGQNFAVSEMMRSREKIRRQLRFLFIYPLVYIGMWIVPFVSHVLQYDDRFAANSPFGLTCVATIFICSQAAVDCWLFSTREKPWTHIPGNEGSFWGSLKFWSGWAGVRRKRRKFNGPGKTREEMVREARAAYKRRDEELAQKRIEAVQGAQSLGLKKGEREWWESTGVDGAMSPVAEEVSHSIEDVEDSSVENPSSDGETTLHNIESTASREESKKTYTRDGSDMA